MEAMVSPTPRRELATKLTREPDVVIRPDKGFLHLELDAVWKYRELLFFMIWRDVKVRYKQTMIGAVWAIIQPLITMVIFTVIFGKFAKIPSDGLPYPVFAFAALLPWTYFSQAFGQSGVSLVNDRDLIRKVYFPRLIIPISATIVPLVDFVISFFVLSGMMVWYEVPLTWNMIVSPVFLILALLTSLSVSLFLSALNVRYRDVRHAIPFLLQIWMYASPIVYPVSLIPEKWRFLYSLNPMVGVIEGFRWALLGSETPHFGVIVVSSLGLLILLFGGLIYFKRMENTFADVI